MKNLTKHFAQITKKKGLRPILAGINYNHTKDQQIEVLKQMLHESNDREREHLKALGVTLEDIEKEID